MYYILVTLVHLPCLSGSFTVKDWVITASRRFAVEMCVGESFLNFLNDVFTSISTIPSITEQTVKSLGKLFDSTLKNSPVIEKSKLRP